MTEEEIKLNWYAIAESGASMTAIHNLREHYKTIENENEQLKEIIKAACKDEEFVCDMLTNEQYDFCKKLKLCK